MRVCCTNIDCMRQNNYVEFEFDPPEKCPIDNVEWSECDHAPFDKKVGLKCPKCGSSEHIAPAWIKEYRMPKELETLEKLRTLDNKLKELGAKNHKEPSQ